MNRPPPSESRSDFLLSFKLHFIDTGDMPPLYFVPDRYSSLLSDHSREGSVFFGGSKELPEDIHWRCLCHLSCRYLSDGMVWQDILALLNIKDGEALTEYFYLYTGMSPEGYADWCRRRKI